MAKTVKRKKRKKPLNAAAPKSVFALVYRRNSGRESRKKSAGGSAGFVVSMNTASKLGPNARASRGTCPGARL
jgi:hypothetical protein